MATEEEGDVGVVSHILRGYDRVLEGVIQTELRNDDSVLSRLGLNPAEAWLAPWTQAECEGNYSPQSQNREASP